MRNRSVSTVVPVTDELSHAVNVSYISFRKFNVSYVWAVLCHVCLLILYMTFFTELCGLNLSIIYIYV